MINRRQLLTGASMLAAERALAQPTGNAGWRDLPWGPSQSANTGGNIGGPSFDQSFLTGSLNPASGAVFSRASTGTYYDSAGVLRTSPVNLVRNSMMVGGVAPNGYPTNWGAPQLLSGGGNSSTFAYGTANGVPYMDLIVSVVTPMGAATPVGLVVETILTGGVAMLTTAAITYQLVAGSIPAGSSFNSVIWPQSTTGFISNIFTPTAAPQRIVTTGSSVASDTQIVLFISINCPAALTYSYTLRISQPQLETGSVATTFIPTTTATSGAPRFDYDPRTLALKGLLLEETSTNLVQFSGDLSNASWNKGGSSTAPVVTGNQAVSPDGTTTASKVVFPAVSGAGANSLVYTSFVPGAVPGALSIWLRGNVGGEQLYLATTDNTSRYSSPRLTLTTQWQRFSFTSPTLSSVSWFYFLGTDLRDVAQAATSAQTVFAWGAQAEGNYMSSHIPTTTGSVTRAADFISYPIANVTGYNPTKGSLIHEYILEGFTPGYNGPLQFIGSDPNADYIDVDEFTTSGATPTIPRLAGSVLNIGGLGTGGCSYNLDPAPANVVHRGGHAWALSAISVGAHDAIPAITVSATTGVPVITALTIAGYMHYQGKVSQWARRTRYWPRQMPQSELNKETTLDGPTLSLDFMAPGTLDPRIVFTRASTGTYVDAAGIVRTAATNAPRWGYDPTTLALKGVLIDEQRTNLSFPSANWFASATPNGSTDGVIQNVGADPAGGNAAMAFIPGSFNAAHQWFTFQNGSPSTTYTFSVFAKAAGMDFFYMELSNNGFGANAVAANFNLTAGTADGVGRIQRYPNGWYRCSITATTPSTATPPYIPNIRVSRDLSTVVTGNNVDGIWVFGHQFEVGTFATSLITTTVAAATRAADLMTIATNVSWYNGLNGTVMTEMLLPDNGNNGYRGVFCLDAGPNVWLRAYTLNGNANIAGNVDFTPLTFGAMTPGTPFRLAATYAPTGTRVALGGVIGTGTAVISSPSTYTTLRFGLGDVAANFANGAIRLVQYWNRDISDAEMQLRTTP